MKKIFDIICGLTILGYIFSIAIILDLKSSYKTLLLLYTTIFGLYWFYQGWIKKQ